MSTVTKLTKMMLAASDDVTRVHLGGLCFRLDESGGLEAMATDGHIAARWPKFDWESMKECLVGSETVMLTRDQLKGLSAGLTGRGKAYPLSVSRINGRLNVKNAAGVTVTMTPGEYNFPYNAVGGFFKVKRAKPVQVSFNANLLLDLVMAMRVEENKYKGCVLEFCLDSAGSAAMTVKAGSDAEGVLMPIRSDCDKVNAETVKAIQAEVIK